MSNNIIILVIKASDIDVSSLPEDKRDIESRAFKDAVYDHLLKNCVNIAPLYSNAYVALGVA
jgi:hypothetical protein